MKRSPQTVWANSQLWNGVRRRFEQIPSCEMVSADGLSKFPAVKWCSQTVWANSPLWNGVRTQFEQILSCEMVSADGLSKFPTVKWCPQTVWANSQLWNDVRRRFKSSWSSRVLAWRSTCSPIRLFFGLLHCVRNDGQVILDCFTAFARTGEWYWIASLRSQGRASDTGLLHCVRKDKWVKG